MMFWSFEALLCSLFWNAFEMLSDVLVFITKLSAMVLQKLDFNACFLWHWNPRLQASSPIMASKVSREEYVSENQSCERCRRAPCILVSFHVLLSLDFLWPPQMESLLAGYWNPRQVMSPMRCHLSLVWEQALKSAMWNADRRRWH